MSGAGGPSPWRWRRYTGNPHDKHLHVSIRHTRAAETDPRSWLGGPAAGVGAGPVDPLPPRPAFPRGGLRRGARGELVSWLQCRLNAIAGAGGHGAVGGRA